MGGVRLRCGAPGEGIVGWAIEGLVRPLDGLVRPLEGLGVTAAERARPSEHPNGATGIDHVVVITPDFHATTEALSAAGMPLTRVIQARGRAMGFRRLGPAILELVEGDAPLRFWGLVVIVSDLDALAKRLGERLGEIRPAVQPGRRIATLRLEAGLGTPVAFMDPER